MPRMIKGRISKPQADMLFVLYALESKGHTQAVPGTALQRMIDSARSAPQAPANFRAGCHTLVKRGLLEQYRNPQSLRLSYRLTNEGRRKGQKIMELFNQNRDLSQ